MDAADKTRIKCDVLDSDGASAGHFTVELVRSWSPNGVDRMIELVRMRYYDGAVFFRALKNFVVQWGMRSKEEDKAWAAQFDPARVAAASSRLKDEKLATGLSNTRGTLSFAMGGKNTRTKQLFINLKDNHYLDKEGFTVIGKVTEGMDDVVSKIYTGYKDGAGQVGTYAKGRENLREKFPLMWEIQQCVVVE